MHSNVLFFPLFLSLRITTDGATGVANTYLRLDIPTPKGAEAAIARAASVEFLSLQKNGAASGAPIEWNVEMIPGFDRDNEVATPIPLAPSDINTNDDPKRNTAITTAGSFLPSTRFRIKYKNKDAVAGVQTAVISWILLVKFST